MLHHGYAKKYSQYLRPLRHACRDITLCEVGILKGTGLAVWSDLFENATLLGLDIDLDHFKNNLLFLKSRGAFRHRMPELHEFDQLEDNRAYLHQILAGRLINVCIDDGLHSCQAIMGTLRDMFPHLDEHFVYFIEDNADVYSVIAHHYPELTVDHEGELTVLSR